MANMNQVMSNLWIGDFEASQNTAELTKHGITHIISAMKQGYEDPAGFTVYRVLIDDTDKTNIIEHLPKACDFIAKARLHSKGVLIHCQAGVSRSTSIVAAYLMREMGLTTEQALHRIRKTRKQAEPSDFFMLQLELFERCDCEWNPTKWAEERRFLMSFAQSQIMDGASPSIVMAYYPSPEASPVDRIAPNLPTSGTSSTPTSSSSSALPTTADASAPLVDAPQHKRLTPKSPARIAEEAAATAKDEPKATLEKIGQKGEVVVVGKRIRCKMCRRELAGREHIIVHETGKGQQAFAPHRRDMAAFRSELEARRMDEVDRENREKLASPMEAELTPAASTPATSSATPPPLSAAPAPPSIAGLRISTPRVAVPGLRVAMPRPQPMARPPVGRPAPGSNAPSTSKTNSEAASATVPVDEILSAAPPPAALPTATTEPPLLPSHLCSSYFVEPLSWMSPILESGVLAGKLVCPGTKCGAKLGGFDWAGAQCSCGAWVVPAFALNVSRVDEIAR